MNNESKILGRKNKMKKKISFSNLIQLWGIILLIAIAGVIVCIDLFITYQGQKIQMDDMRADYIEQEKQQAMREVERIVNMMDHERMQLKALNGTESYVNDIEEQLIATWMERINNIRFGKNLVGYLFVDDWRGKSLAHGAQPDLIGTEMWEYEDSRGNKTTQLLIATSRNKDGGFAEFWWRKPDTGEESHKIVYAKAIPEWELFVGSGVYMEDIDKNVAALEMELNARTKAKLLLFTIIVVIAVVLFFILFHLLSNRLKKEFDVFTSFFENSAVTNVKIDRNQLKIEDFALLSDSANLMIDKREQAEEELKESLNREKFWADVVRNANVGVAVGYPDGSLGICNIAYQEMTGYSEDELQSIDWNTVLTPPEWTKSEMAVLQELHKTKKSVVYEKEYIRKDGTRIPIELMVNPGIDEDGNIYCYYAFVMDITERKENLEEMEKLAKFPAENPNPVLRISKDGVVLYHNIASKSLLKQWQYQEGKQLQDKWYQHVMDTLKSNSIRVIETEVDDKVLSLTFTPIIDKQFVNVYGFDVTESKKAEEVLQKTYARHSAMIENIGDVIAIVGADGMNKYQSPNIEKWFGWKPEDLIGTNGWEKMHPEDIERIQKEFSEMLKKETASIVEYRFKCKDGNYKWIELTALNRINDPAINGVLLNYHDITERKRAEEKLIESEEKYRSLIENMEEIIYFTDTAGKIVHISPQVSRYGYTPDELIAMDSFIDLIFPADVERVATEYLTAVTTGEVNPSEYRLIDHQGEPHWVETRSRMVRDASGNIIGNTGVLRDIAERKQAEEKLRNLSTVVEQSSEGIAIADVEGNITFVNNAWALLHNYETREELIGKPLSIFHNQQQIEKEVIPFNQKVKENGFHTGEVGHIRKDGAPFPTLMSTTLLKDEQGNPYAIAGLAKDITERKQAEEENKNLARFPSENPNPVLRITKDGTIVFANPNSSPLLDLWECEIGESLSQNWHRFILDAIDQGERSRTEVVCGEKTFDITFAPIPESDFINVYGLDITERKQAQKDLQMSEQKSRNQANFLDVVIESSPFAMQVMDAKGVIIRTNQALRNILNVTDDMIIGKYNVLHDENLVAQELMPVVEAVFNDLRSAHFNLFWTGTKAGDVDLSIANELWIDVSMFPITDEAGKLVNVVCQYVDITARIQAEEKLKKNITSLQQAEVMAQLGNFERNWQTGEGYWSKGFLKLLGIDKKSEALSHKDFTQFIHPDDFERVTGHIRKTLSEHIPMNIEFRLVQATGQMIHIHGTAENYYDQNDKPILTVGVFQDITHQIESQKELVENEKKLREAQDMAHLGFWSWDVKSGEVEWSEEVFRIFGLDPDTFTPQIDSILALSPWPEDHHRNTELINHAVESHTPGHYEQKFIRPDKSIGHYYSTFQGRYDENGELVLIVGTVLDITDRKLAEEEIHKLNADLEDRVIKRTAQLEAVNKELEAFSYSVSHDLRAPLRHVSGYVDLLGSRFQDELPEKAKYYLNSIADSSHQMGALIDDLLEFSRSGRAEMRESTLDMNPIVKDMSEQLCRDYPKRNIEWVIAPLPPVHGDSAMLNLVWTNLLNNAVKFTQKKKKARIEIGFHEEKKELVCFVRDNGVGFDMKYAQKLFGVFQRLHLKEDFEGTGIGLANVRRIISRHGGRTWAEAELDKGATFYFTLPKNGENKKP
jgi:PAS domain S-box-containing protein